LKLAFTAKLNPKLGQPLKPSIIPEGFFLIQDTNEQKPLWTDNESWVINKTLRNGKYTRGDYSIKGFEDKFCIERKQMSDFYSYIGKERMKTTHKMHQFQQMNWVGFVIEASEDDILMGHPMSQVSPETARQALVSFEIRYGVHVYYNRSRECIKRWILDRAIKWFKVQREV